MQAAVDLSVHKKDENVTSSDVEKTVTYYVTMRWIRYTVRFFRK